MPKPILIYQPKGPAGEYAEWAVNLHNGCTNGCTYCYNRRGFMSHAFGDEPKVAAPIRRWTEQTHRMREKEGMLEWDADMEYDFQRIGAMLIVKEDIEKIGAERLIADGGVFMSFKCDPLELSHQLMTGEVFEIIARHHIPVTILTKSVDWLDRNGWQSYLRYEPWKELITIGFTLTGMDEMERNAPSNAERIHALKRLHYMGIKTFVSLEPVVSFDASLRMIEQASLYCNEFRIGLMSPYKKTRYSVFDLVDFIDIVNSMRQEQNLDIRWKVSVTEALRKKGISYTLTDGVLDFPQDERARLDLQSSLTDSFMFGDINKELKGFGILGKLMNEVQKQEMIHKVNQAVRMISDQDSEFGLNYLNLDDDDSVKIKNAFSEVVNNGICLLKLLKEYE